MTEICVALRLTLAPLFVSTMFCRIYWSDRLTGEHHLICRLLRIPYIPAVLSTIGAIQLPPYAQSRIYFSR